MRIQHVTPARGQRVKEVNGDESVRIFFVVRDWLKARWPL